MITPTLSSADNQCGRERFIMPSYIYNKGGFRGSSSTMRVFKGGKKNKGLECFGEMRARKDVTQTGGGK